MGMKEILEDFDAAYNDAFNRGDAAGCAAFFTEDVVLIAPDLLAREIERLHLSCRRLIWVNPLLRWDGFAPRARGVQAILPHVDSLYGGHSVASLEALGRALAAPADRGARDRLLSALA